jgi:predicted phage replisome organizer
MTDVKWIKLSLKIFDDEKIKLIEAMPECDTVLIVWVKLLVLAGKTNDNGYIYLNKNIAYTDEMLATIFNRPLNTVRLALEILVNFEMIEYDENKLLHISNWEKYQNIESMDKVREQTNQRVAKYREKQKTVKSDCVDNSDKVDKPAKIDNTDNTDKTSENDIKNKNCIVTCNVTVTQSNATEEERREKREERRK